MLAIIYCECVSAPIIDLNGAEELIGTIREDERVVSLSPQIRILPETGETIKYFLLLFSM